MSAPSTPSPPAVSRLPWILAMQSLILVVLVYPFYLREEWQRSIIGVWNDRAADSWPARLALSELKPLLTFQTSPLILKGALAAAALTAFICVLLAKRFLVPFMADGAAPAAAPPHRRSPGAHVPWLLVVLWLAVSAAWSPTPELSRAAVPWVLVFGLFGFALLRRGLRLDEVRQLAVLLMLLGAAVSIISILQATGLFGGLIFDYFHRFADPRNAYGSLMGHNTAVASFLMMTLFPSIALAFGTGSRAALWSARGCLTLALLAIVLVQSRAAWLIGPPLIAAFLLAGAGTRGGMLRRAGVGVLALAALAVASQSIRAPWNPLYLRDRPVARRLADFSFERLQKEARLRLFICSIPLVTDQPWRGHGLYAFQYVYPKAQGDYFAEHPDTKLGFTNKRSHMAHNEYLQVAVEQGIPGLMLLLLALGEVAWRGRCARRGLDRQEDRWLHAAFGFSTLGLALGALVDFPFHVPQLVLPWIFCAAAFASAGPGADRPAPAAAPPLPDARGDAPGQLLRIDRVFGLTLALILLCLIPLANYGFARSLAADVEFLGASSELTAIQKGQIAGGRAAEPAALESVIQRLRHVVLVQPSHAHARFLIGEAFYTLGRALAPAPDAAADVARLQAIQAATAYQAAIQYIEESLKTLRTHHTFYILALCYRGLAGLSTGERREAYLREYQRGLEESVHFAPGYEPALYLLSEWLALQPDPDRERIAAYRRAILTHAPKLFQERYVNEAVRMITIHDWPGAVRAGEALLEVDSANPRFINLAIYAHLHRAEQADRDRVVELCDRISAAAARFEAPGREEALLTLRVHLYRALALRDWSEALRWLAPYEDRSPEKQAWLRAIELSAAARTGTAADPSRVPVSEALEPEAWERAVTEKRVLVELRLADDLAAAREAIDHRLMLAGEPTIGFWVEAMVGAQRVGDAAREAEARERLRRLAPSHPLLGRAREADSGARPTEARSGPPPV